MCLWLELIPGIHQMTHKGAAKVAQLRVHRGPDQDGKVCGQQLEADPDHVQLLDGPLCRTVELVPSYGCKHLGGWELKYCWNKTPEKSIWCVLYCFLFIVFLF